LSDIPPVAPAAPGTTATQSPSAQQPGQRTLPQAPVTEAPPQLQSPPQPVTVPGRVISSDPQQQRIRIDTAQGEIDVRSSAQLAPGTEVIVSLATSRGTLLATITVLRQQIRVSADLEQLIPAETTEAQPSIPPPPLKPGDTVTALQLPPDRGIPPQQTSGTPPVSASAPPPVPQSAPLITIEQAATFVRQLRPSDFARLPLPEGLSPAIVKTVLAAPEKAAAFLRALPPEIQQKISAFLFSVMQKTQPQLMQKARDVAESPQSPPEKELQTQVRAQIQPQAPSPAPQQETQPQTAPQAPPQQETQTPAPQPDESVDANLLHILRAQIGAKVTQQILQQPHTPETPSAPPGPALARTLGVLLPLMEQLMATGNEESSTPAAPQTILAQALPRALQAAVTLPQNMFEVRVLQILTPPPPASAPTAQLAPAPPPALLPSLPQAQVMQGEVESVTPSGLPVIRTDDGAHFVLQTPAPLPQGSRITFEARPMTPREIMQHAMAQPQGKATGPLPAPAAQPLDPLRAREWPALEKALNVVERDTPAVAASVKESLPALPPALPVTAVPVPAARSLAPPALLFLAALRLGDIENWLGGKTIQALRDAGHGALAERLAGDFGKIAEQAQTPLPGGWKMISMPLLYDDSLSQMQFFVRRQDEREGGGRQDENARPVTRFLLNLSLSRLGDMQLDGLVHHKQFDLILRTGEPLTIDIRQEIMKRFALGLDQTGMQGGVSFQVKRQSWVTVEMPQRGTMA
jgi:hypothetical protein